ncbi:MAG: ribonuclease III [Planctomycetota bacterium]
MSPASQIESAIGYRFRDESILREALTHASHADHRLASNERMEFLGDAILGYVVCAELFHRFPDLQEGDLTKIKSAVVSRRTCAKVSRSLNLVAMMRLGKGMAEHHDAPSSVAAAVLESLIAAIYLDGGIEPARAFIHAHISDDIDEAADSAHQHNYKSLLQQHAQRSLPATPDYVLLDEKGPDHAKAFEVAAEVEGRRFSSAWANSKKEAEQKAAMQALIELGVAELDDNGRLQVREGAM